ncbi:MAG: dioxygenase, partial [Deltaproteobacteria bacterium]|nr:dioxygenase [Deltaproteobacteria bacterium]
EAHPVSIGATRPLPLIYDFYGFPDKFYKLQYPAPGAPDVAARVRQLLTAANIAHVDDPERGLDHGTYIPLMCMYPAADLPVLQVSLPSMNPAEIFAMGKALAPLRDEGVLLVGSGFITHNLRALSLRDTPAWASDFDSWTADALSRRDHDALLDYRAKAPGVQESLPTHEHFVPVMFSAGAAPDATIEFPITGFWWGGAMTRRSVQFG